MLGTVFHDLTAFIVLKIKVDIRHRNTPRVQKAFEEEIVGKRFDQGDIQGIGHHGAGSGAASVVPNTMLTGILAQIPYDQKISIEAHFMNDFQFIFETLAYFRIFAMSSIISDKAFFA